MLKDVFHIKTGLIVGGLLESDGSIADRDADSLETLLWLAKRKTPIQVGDTQWSVSNLEYGDDFIRDTPYTNFLYLSWVNKGMSNPRDPTIGAESPLLEIGHTWKGAIISSRPDFIAIRTDNYTCVGLDDIPQDDYHLVYGDPEQSRPSCVFARNDLVKAYP